jgi:hypothetical protein
MSHQTHYDKAEQVRNKRISELKKSYNENKIQIEERLNRCIEENKEIDIRFEEDMKRIENDYDKAIQFIDTTLDPLNIPQEPDYTIYDIELKSKEIMNRFNNSLNTNKKDNESKLIKTNFNDIFKGFYINNDNDIKKLDVLINKQSNFYYFDKEDGMVLYAGSACVTICIIFCHYFSVYKGDILDKFRVIMECGTQLYHIWQRHKIGVSEKNFFPTIHEVVHHERCQKFKKRFIYTAEHFGYLYSEEQEIIQQNIETNQFFLHELFIYYVRFFKERPNATEIAIIFICKDFYSFSVIIKRPDISLIDGLSDDDMLTCKLLIYFFDSHGTINSPYIEYFYTISIQSIINYISTKFDIIPLKNDTRYKKLKSIKGYQGIREIVKQYGYTAEVFCK